MNMESSFLLILMSIFVLGMATAADVPPVEELEVEDYSRVETRVHSCPNPLPDGVTRPPPVNRTVYYPIGDKHKWKQMLENVGYIGNEHNLQKLLSFGCPKLSSVPTPAGIMSNHSTLGAWVLKQCTFTDPIKYQQHCEFPDIDTKYNFHSSVTLLVVDSSGASHQVAFHCHQNVFYSWIVSSSVPQVPPGIEDQIREHVTSKGFDWADARIAHFDKCPSP